MKHELLTLLIVLLSVLDVQASDFPKTTDLVASASQAQEAGKVLVVYVTMAGCPYCAKLEADLLNAAYQNGELDPVHFVELEWADQQVTDFDGAEVATDTLLKQYGIVVTPTMLFLGPDGEELSERLIGYRSEDFYWQYFQARIDQASEWLD